MNRRNILALILAFLLSTSAHAIMPDIFQGCVLDAETHEPLEGVHIEITEVIPGWAQSDEVQYSDSLGRQATPSTLTTFSYSLAMVNHCKS